MFKYTGTKKFSKEEIEVLLDAMDIYGFDSISYVSSEDAFYVLFYGDQETSVNGEHVEKYLSDRIKGVLWKEMSCQKFMHMPIKSDTFTIMTYTGMDEEVCYGR